MPDYTAALVVCWKLGMLGDNLPVCMAAFGFPSVEVDGKPVVLQGHTHYCEDGTEIDVLADPRRPCPGKEE